jgi:hypothetical protein
MSALDHQTPADGGLGLPDGTEVVARRGRSRDLEALRSLAALSGIVCDELELARLLRSDPTERLILCATTQVDGAEAVIGTGVIELGAGATMPSLILVDPAYGASLGGWLAETLVAQARVTAA